MFFDPVRPTPANQTDALVLNAPNLSSPLTIPIFMTYKVAVSPSGATGPGCLWWWKALFETPSMGAPVISYPTGEDTVCADYFMCYGTSDTTNQDVTITLTVDGVAANPTVNSVNKTPRWLVEITMATAGVGNLAASVGGISSTATMPKIIDCS
jgi:hypothetical protein